MLMFLFLIFILTLFIANDSVSIPAFFITSFSFQGMYRAAVGIMNVLRKKQLLVNSFLKYPVRNGRGFAVMKSVVKFW